MYYLLSLLCRWGLVFLLLWGCCPAWVWAGGGGGAGIPCACSAISFLYLTYIVFYSNLLCYQVYKLFFSFILSSTSSFVIIPYVYFVSSIFLSFLLQLQWLKSLLFYNLYLFLSYFWNLSFNFEIPDEPPCYVRQWSLCYALILELSRVSASCILFIVDCDTQLLVLGSFSSQHLGKI